VRIARVTPGTGTNRVSIEVIRPPDPTTPSGAGVSIVTGETSIGWLAPAAELGAPSPAPDVPPPPAPGGLLGPPVIQPVPPAPGGLLGPPTPVPEIKLGAPSPLGAPSAR
jgi:hypothetical protein